MTLGAGDVGFLLSVLLKPTFWKVPTLAEMPRGHAVPVLAEKQANVVRKTDLGRATTFSQSCVFQFNNALIAHYLSYFS